MLEAVRVIVAGCDGIMCRLLMANLGGANRELLSFDLLADKPRVWARADVVVLDVGNYSRDHAGLYEACLRGCRTCGGSVVLLYDPPWPKPSLARFRPAREFPKPASVAEIAGSVTQLLVGQAH